MPAVRLLVVFLFVFPIGYVLGLDCGDNYLGMQNNIIQDHQITASSGTAGDQARLNYTNGPSWCAMRNDVNPYLQIDLGTPHIICAVATQGDHQGKKFVKAFQLHYSNDGNIYKPYSGSSDSPKTWTLFYGNVDASGIVKQILHQGIIAKYLRILPMIHHGAVCMRTEIYGIRLQSKNLAISKSARQSSTSINGTASRAVDGNRDGTWLGGSCTQCDQRDKRQWWRVDLGKSVEVDEVSVFTRTHPQWGLSLWNTTFELRIGYSDTSSTSNPTCGGQYGIIPSGSITIVCIPPMNGRYVTIRQLEPNQLLSLCEVEIYGHEYPDVQVKQSINKSAVNRDGEPWLMVDLGHSIPVYKIYINTYYAMNDILKYFQIQIGNNGNKGGSSNPGVYGHVVNKNLKHHYIFLSSIMIGRYLTIQGNYKGSSIGISKVEVYSKAPVCGRQGIGISNDQAIPDNKLLGSTMYSKRRSAAKARLLGNSSWRPLDGDVSPCLQIDLGEIYYVFGVATQGDPHSHERTRKYKLKWSFNGTWEFVRNKTSKAIMIFTGNRDSSSIVKHIFTAPLKAEMIRFCPVEKNRAYALRVEIYGVNIQGPQKPNLVYDKDLDPRNKSHTDLVCRADGGVSIKWYHNDTDITSQSSGAVRTGATIMSTLRVNYTSADDVDEKYSCGEAVGRKRDCTSLDYICQVDYGSYRKQQARERVTVILRVHNPPIVELKQSSRSILVMIRPNRTDDQGNITKYSIELDGKKRAVTNLSTYDLIHLKPYTKYTVRIMASSKIGISEWSRAVVVMTLQAEPTAAPNKVWATKIEDGKFNIFWDEIPQQDANGEIVAYEIQWKPVNLSSSQAKNATKSPYVLVGLSPHVAYNVSIRGYTVCGPGPASTPITINKATGTNSIDRSSLTSSSSESFLLIIIIVATVIPAVIITVIAITVIVVLRKRHKKLEDNPVRLHYEARATEHNDEVSMVEENGEKDETGLNNTNDIEDAASSDVKRGNTLNQDATFTRCPVPVEQFIDCMGKVGNDKNDIITKEFKNMRNELQFPSLVAKKPVNKTKNRYGNIIPYDHSRVVLEKVKEDEDSDYINASYIRGFDGRHISYIATQGPNQKTVVDFWRMIWQEKTSVIVMLTGLNEGQKTKCEKYWPDDCETYLDISVQLQKTEVFADYCIRSFYLTKTKSNEQRCVFQYHYTAWPDKGVPQHATQLLAFRRRLVSDTAMVCPWVVHCSAGVGRTGAFLAVDAMLRQAQEKETIDILNYVKAMRENRPYMVQTPEQYIFVHMAILEFLTCGITEIQVQQLTEEMEKLAKVDENENLSGYEMEFKHLSQVCPPVQDDEIKAGNEPCNNRKNRFPHIVPLDKARVFLQADVDEEGANYINASYVNGYRQKHAYIMTQAPLDNTIGDFWKMIYDHKLETVVMLNNLQEGNVSYPKYWPHEGSEQIGDFTVEIIQEEHKDSLTLRTFTLIHKSDGPEGMHKVKHYQHKDWSDSSVPSDVRTMLDLIEMLQRSQQQSCNKCIVIQCSDGIGRSGTLCTILSLLDRVKTEQMVDVFQTVKALRISRPGAVENPVQYQFCFQVVMDYVESFSEYSNFDG